MYLFIYYVFIFFINYVFIYLLTRDASLNKDAWRSAIISCQSCTVIIRPNFLRSPVLVAGGPKYTQTNCFSAIQLTSFVSLVYFVLCSKNWIEECLVVTPHVGSYLADWCFGQRTRHPHYIRV